MLIQSIWLSLVILTLSYLFTALFAPFKTSLAAWHFHYRCLCVVFIDCLFMHVAVSCSMQLHGPMRWRMGPRDEATYEVRMPGSTRQWRKKTSRVEIAWRRRIVTLVTLLYSIIVASLLIFWVDELAEKSYNFIEQEFILRIWRLDTKLSVSRPPEGRGSLDSKLSRVPDLGVIIFIPLCYCSSLSCDR